MSEVNYHPAFKEFSDHFCKLTKVLGYVAFSANQVSTRTTHIHFVKSEHRNRYENEPRGPHKTYLCDYIYDATHYEWIKIRQPIPELTDTERLLYGKT